MNSVSKIKGKGGKLKDTKEKNEKCKRESKVK